MTQGKHLIIIGDVLRGLARLPDGSVHCCVTSPPYWGLRDYGTATWVGGDEVCDHKGKPFATKASINANCGTGTDRKNAEDRDFYREMCGKCGARRVDAQIGLESTPEEYIAAMVEVFREVRRVLREDGTLWMNLGDSYASTPPGCGAEGVSKSSTLHGANGISGKYRETLKQSVGTKRSTIAPGLKPKDLCGIPWRVALALQADGWYLRADIIWAKPNPMPESVTDRPTKSHEYIFLLTKKERYYYDAEAIKEQSAGTGGGSCFGKQSASDPMAQSRNYERPDYLTRNCRSVWSIPTQPYKEAHFATFPEALAERCIRAGTSERGCCAECGAPWVRVLERGRILCSGSGQAGNLPKGKGRPDGDGQVRPGHDIRMGQTSHNQTLGWQSRCSCGSSAIVPCTVLDPFLGSGTTAAVACLLGRDAIGIELNPEYAALAEKRIASTLRPGTFRTMEASGEPEGLLFQKQESAA